MSDPEPASPLPCPGCGREYGPDRFPRGRTFRCTCGERVGRRLRTGLLDGDGRPRFLADVMLAKLARWLRVLGYDCAWEAEIDDEALVRRSVEERRILLTRDRRLAEDWWVEGIVPIRGADPLEQLREVAAAVRLSRDRLFTRCTHCNEALEPATEPEVLARVPAEVRSRQTRFLACPTCRRVYWNGGHVQRMRHALDAALGE